MRLYREAARSTTDTRRHNYLSLVNHSGFVLKPTGHIDRIFHESKRYAKPSIHKICVITAMYLILIDFCVPSTSRRNFTPIFNLDSLTFEEKEISG